MRWLRKYWPYGSILLLLLWLNHQRNNLTHNSRISHFAKAEEESAFETAPTAEKVSSVKIDAERKPSSPSNVDDNTTDDDDNAIYESNDFSLDRIDDNDNAVYESNDFSLDRMEAETESRSDIEPQHTTPHRRRQLHLITSYYVPPDVPRRRELNLALRLNIENPAIDFVHILHEKSTAPNQFEADSSSNPSAADYDKSKVRWIHNSRGQPQYFDLFKYANENIDGETSIAAISHNDIVWEASTMNGLQRLAPRLVFALSRHYNRKYCPKNKEDEWQYCDQYIGSHDTFAFIPRLDPKVYEPLKYKPNSWGGENVVVATLKSNGLIVENPCHDIISYHIHCSGYRPNTGERISDSSGDNVAPPKPLKAICNRNPSPCSPEL